MLNSSHTVIATSLRRRCGVSQQMFSDFGTLYKKGDALSKIFIYFFPPCSLSIFQQMQKVVAEINVI